MIERLEIQEIEQSTGSEYTIIERVPATSEQMHDKINELVDMVNFVEEEYNNQLYALSVDVKNKEERIEKLEKLVSTLVEENNTHERQIDELQMKLKTLQGAFIVRLDENDEPATATPLFKED